MKIRIAICTEDIQYSKNVVNYFQAHYYDRFIWNVFTQITYLNEYLEENELDIILLGKELLTKTEQNFLKNRNEIWACLVDYPDEENSTDFEQVKKYTRGEQLYRNLLELYSRKENLSYHEALSGKSKTEIYAVVSAGGGTGASTAASAFAIGWARLEKVLYLNLENLGITDMVYGNENEGFEEILFALKSRRKALEIKLSSTVSKAKNGVYFFASNKNAMDMLELGENDIKELLLSLGRLGEYDKVILDVGNGLGNKELAALFYANRIIMITEDTEISQQKLERYLSAIQAVEEQRKADIFSKIIIFYNKIIKQQQLPEHIQGIRVMGGFSRIENGTYEGIVNRLSQLETIHKVR